MNQERHVLPLTAEPDTDDEIRQMLRSVQGQGGPSRAQLDRLAVRLAPAVGVSAGALQGASLPTGVAPAGPGEALGATTTSVAPGAAAPLATGAKVTAAKLGTSALVKVVGLAGIVGLGAAVYGSLRTAPETSAPPTPPATRVQTPAPPAEEHGRVVEPAPDPSPSTAAEVEVAPKQEPAREPRNAKSAPKAPVAVPAVDAPKPSEFRLMADAQAQRSQPAALLVTLREHARLYPDGMLAQEREVLRVEALVKLGRLRQAERQLGKLEASHASSPHLSRLRALLEAAKPAH